jgi:hypothetical protein
MLRRHDYSVNIAGGGTADLRLPNNERHSAADQVPRLHARTRSPAEGGAVLEFRYRSPFRNIELSGSLDQADKSGDELF